MVNSLIVSFAGYPETISSLMPDNGIASLSASLHSQGIESKIIDYSTIQTIEELTPLFFSKELTKIYESFTSKNTGKIGQAYNFMKLKGLQPFLNSHRERMMQKYATDLSELVGKEKPDFVAFKLWMGDGFVGTKMMIDKIRQDHPSVKIYGGGPHAYTFKDKIFDFLSLDALCYDEGENTIVDLANHSVGKKDLKNIPNIYFKDGNKVVKTEVSKIKDLNSLPIPIYDKNVYLSIDDKLNIFIIDETRGCAYTCPFCVQSGREDNNYRAKSGKRIVDEMQKLQQEKGANLFRFGGQMTTGQIFNDVAEEIINRGMKVNYSGFAHVSSIQKANYSLLKESGLEALFFGIESGDQRLLDDVFLKRTKVDTITSTLINAKYAGIDTIASLIYPAPFETSESRQNTLNLINETNPSSVLVYFSGLYPDSVWTNNQDKFGFNIESNDFARDVMTYKTKYLMPPSFWEPLPYSMNGKSFKEFARETEEFAKEVGKNHLLFAVDEHFLIANHLQINPKTFVSDMKQSFYTGKTEKLYDLMERIR